MVLTSARNHYVDIRLLKAVESNVPEAGSGPFNGLDWAFAGTSSTLRSPIAGDAAEIVEWQHWIDSRNLGGKDQNATKDIGRCFSRSNGDTQELGSMINPETGVETEYEELWGSLAIESTGSDIAEKVVVVLRTTDKPGQSRTVDTPSVTQTKGLVIRIGQLIQGILEHRGGLTVERWTYDQASKKWTEVVRIGATELPSPPLFDPIKLVEGQHINFGPISWQVIEQSTWID